MSDRATIDPATLCILMSHNRLSELSGIGAAIQTAVIGDTLHCLNAKGDCFETVYHGHVTAFRNAGLVKGHQLTDLGRLVARGGK